MTTVKAKRTLTMQVEVQVDLGDIELTEYDDYSKYLHDRDVAALHTGRLRHDLDVMFEGYEDISVTQTTPQGLSVHIHPESQALMDSWVNDEEAESDRLFTAVEALGETLHIKECVWSFSERDREDQKGVDYRQGLLDNPMFREGRVQFVYNDGWEDDEPIVSPIYTNPTYQDVFVVADKLLQLSKDKHHVFVEGATDKGVDEGGVQVYALYYGS